MCAIGGMRLIHFWHFVFSFGFGQQLIPTSNSLHEVLNRRHSHSNSRTSEQNLYCYLSEDTSFFSADCCSERMQPSAVFLMHIALFYRVLKTM